MGGLHARAVVSAHVGGAVVHVNGEEQGAVIGVAAQIQQLFGQIEAIVNDSDDSRARAIGVGKLRIGTALDQSFNYIRVSVASREHQRRKAAGGMVRVLALGDGGDVR